MTPESQSSEERSYSPNEFFYGFLIKATVLFACLYGAYNYLLLETQTYSKYLGTTHSVVSSILDGVGLEHEANFSRHAYSGTFKTEEWAEVAVDKRTDGILEIVLLVSLVLAWPGRWMRKLLYAAVGVGVLYSMVVARLTAAMLVDQYMPLRYDFLATWIFPMIPLLFIALYFLFYIRQPADEPAGGS